MCAVEVNITNLVKGFRESLYVINLEIGKLSGCGGVTKNGEQLKSQKLQNREIYSMLPAISPVWHCPS